MAAKSKGKWMQKAVKKPGALRKTLGTKKGKKIPMSEIDTKISALKKKSAGKKKLTAAQAKMQKRLVLAKTFKKAAKKRAK